MTVSLKHQFVSNVADSPDATLVQPSNWNAEHTLTANADSLLGAVTAGNVTEITCTSAGRALLDDADASAQRTTLGLGTISTQNANNVSITGGSITGITDLAVADGGTGASDAATARTNLGIGTLGTQNANAVAITGGTIVANASGISIRDADASNVMTIAVGSNLTANTTLTLTTGATTNRTLDISATNVTVSVAGAALIDDADAAAQRTTLGLGTIATQNANNVSITGGSITGITDLAVADGGTGASDAATARTNLGVGTIATQNANNVSITGGSITGITDLAVADGGTGASDAATARTNLGIGTIATQNANNVSITGGSITGITDLAVADGGTGASDAATARTNLGIGTMGTQNANAVSITGGTIVANASGISIRDADASNVMTIAVGSNLTANTTLTLTTGATTDRTLDISATNVTISVAGAALIDDADATAQRTTLGLGTIATQNANAVSITGGSVTGITDLAVADGGTGASDAGTARTNLGLAIGTNVQAYSARLGEIAALSPTLDNFIVGSGTSWVLETPATARTSLGAAASGAVTSSGLTMTSARLLGRSTANTGAIEEVTVGSGLTLSAGSLTSSVFPAGTVMLFKQTAAPTGWTKILTDDNKALRIVTGTVGTGGTVAFTTAFASQTPSGNIGNTVATGSLDLVTQGGSIANTTATGTVGATTLATNQIPAHTHSLQNSGNAGSGGLANISGNGNLASTGSTGGGLSHTHSFTGDAHTHVFTGNSHNHTFTGTAHNHTFTGTAINLAVQYVDVIAASKD